MGILAAVLDSKSDKLRTVNDVQIDEMTFYFTCLHHFKARNGVVPETFW